MTGRCENPENVGFEHYGARGILVCEQWHAFDAFLADMGERPVGTTLDRVDVNGNYEPGNVRWATRREQRWNTRRDAKSVRLVSLNGEPLPLSEVCARLGIAHSAVRRRLATGFGVWALYAPGRRGKRHTSGAAIPASTVRDVIAAYRAGGVSQAALARKYGVTFQWVHDVVTGRRRSMALSDEAATP
jgi:hypothetical protein